MRPVSTYRRAAIFALAPALTTQAQAAPAAAEDVFRKAEAHFAKGEWAQSEKLYLEEAKRVPRSSRYAEAMRKAGQCRVRMKDAKTARRFFEAVTGDPRTRRESPEEAARAFRDLHGLLLEQGDAVARERLLDDDGVLRTDTFSLRKSARRTWPMPLQVIPTAPVLDFVARMEGQQAEGGKAIDTIHGRIVNVDIDIDANGDGNITDADEPLEVNPGGFVAVGTNNLARIELKVEPAGLPGKVRLWSAGGSRIRLWKNPARTDLVRLPITWASVTHMPNELFVEGLTNSASLCDVVLCFEYDENPAGQDNDLFKSDDMLRLTVVNVRLKEISFSGTNCHAIKKDDGSLNYTAPHWQDNSMPPDGDADDPCDRMYPICFTRNTKMKVSAKWRIEPTDIGTRIRIRGDGPGNLDFPAKSASALGDDHVITNVECQNPFANEVDFIDPMIILWQYSIDGGSAWHDAGTSKNQTYVTLGDPLTTVYHTLVHIGCTNADGENTISNTVDAVYSEFTDLDVRRVLDNKQMTYWSGGDMGATETAEILRRSDANGNCQAWSALVRDCFKVQGLVADRISASPILDDSVLIKNWRITDPTCGTGRYPYLFGIDAIDMLGIPGQGNDNPPGIFNGHWITLCNGCYYDGSYGTAKVSGNSKDKAYEDMNFDGYGPAESLITPSGFGVRRNDVTTNSLGDVVYRIDN